MQKKRKRKKEERRRRRRKTVQQKHHGSIRKKIGEDTGGRRGDVIVSHSLRIQKHAGPQRIRKVGLARYGNPYFKTT